MSEYSFKSHLLAFRQAKGYWYCGFVAVLVVLSVLLSVAYKNWEHVSRCGGIITVLGASLVVRRLLRDGPNRKSEPPPQTINRNQLNIEYINHGVRERFDNYAEAIGFGILVFGTFLWSYGDFILAQWLPFNT